MEIRELLERYSSLQMKKNEIESEIQAIEKLFNDLVNKC